MSNPSTPTGITVDGHPVTVEAMSAAMGRRGCALCRTREIALIGVWRPGPAQVARVVALTEPDVGPVRPGKNRIIVYGLCSACVAAFPRLELAERVEARVLGLAWPRP